MKNSMTAWVVLAVSFALACGSGETVVEPDQNDILRFETGEFSVPPGDVFQCFYTDVITDREFTVNGAFGEQSGQGGHHLTVYYTENKRAPENHPCDDVEMAEWRMIGGTGGDSAQANEKLRLPAGYGFKVPAGVQIVMQSHYINVGETFTANDYAGLEILEPEDVIDHVGEFLVNDELFDVPAHEQLKSVTTCTVPQTISLLILIGHQHEWGTRYSLETVDEEGNTIDMLYDYDWNPAYVSDPPVHKFEPDAPFVLKAGTRLRQTCEWQNIEDYNLIFPREMCLAYGFHFPSTGSRVYCETE